MSFDWTTFAFQLVNVIVLLTILRHYLFGPVAEVIARRQNETNAALAATEAAKAAADAATAAAQAEAANTTAARHDVLLKAQAEAHTLQAGMLEKARVEAARIVAEGRAAAARNSEADEALSLARARDLAKDITERALAAQPPGLAGYADRLAAALNALGPSERSALLAGANLRLAAPLALSDADLAQVRAVLAPFGVAPGAETDPGLIAGLDLRSDTGAVRNSLAHDIDQIAEAMRDARST